MNEPIENVASEHANDIPPPWTDNTPKELEFLDVLVKLDLAKGGLPFLENL